MMMSTRERILAWAPEERPLLWIVLNSICFLWSLVLLGDLIYAEEELSERPFATEQYLVWCLVTTIVWCFEAGLSSWYHNWKLTQWMLLLELAIAVYFVIEAIVMVYQWHVPEYEVEEELLDVGIAVAAYLWVLVAAIRTYREKHQQQGDIDDLLEEIGTDQDSPSAEYQLA